jgi:hypothetical protein
MVPPWASPFSPRSTADQPGAAGGWFGPWAPPNQTGRGPQDFDSWQETIYLLRSPANARRLMEAVARDKSGEAAVVKTMEELEALAGE